MSQEASVPDLLGALLPYFEKVSAEEQPVLLATLERFAAEHYRRWAQQETDAQRRQSFYDCAEREEFIADTVESVVPGAVATARALKERFPEIPQLYANTVCPLSHRVQWKAQIAGELGGASLYRQFADATKDPAVRAKYLLCAQKEEDSVRFLETLV